MTTTTLHAVDELGTRFADAVLRTGILRLGRAGWDRARILAHADRFCEIARPLAKAGAGRALDEARELKAFAPWAAVAFQAEAMAAGTTAAERLMAEVVA